MYAYYVCCAHSGQRALGSQEQELQAAVSHHMDAGNRTCVLYKGSKCS